MSDNHQNSGFFGVLIYKVLAHCPKCSNLETHWIKDQGTIYTKKDCVKMYKDDFVQILCSNDDCENAFAVKIRSINVEWEVYDRVEKEKT